MIPEPMELFNQAILARLALVEADLARLKAILGDKFPALPADGAQGTMTPVEGHTPWLDLEGWVTPNTTYGANIREWPTTAQSNPPIDRLEFGDALAIQGRTSDYEGRINPATGKPFVWYMVKADHQGLIREDVVTFSQEKPVATPAVTWGRWDAPIQGYRIENTHLNHRNHHGIDLSAALGTPIVSPALGTVVKRFDCLSCNPQGDGAASLQDANKGHGYGNFLIVRYSFKDSPRAAQDTLYMHQHLFLIFAHLQSISVHSGQQVTYGQEIGRVGSTGNSTGSHLHIEARYSENLNPDWWAIRGNEIDPSLLFSL